MLCQNCNLNEASIHLYTNVNGNQQQVDLCQNCYKIMKSDPDNPLNQFNQTGGSNFFDDFFSDLNNFRSSNGDLPNTPPTQEGGNRGNGGPGGPRQQAPQQLQGLLESSALTHPTDIARRGDIDPVIGRDEEIIRVIEILNRRTKNNPVLIGEPGVGKTAVVEGLAQKIVDGSVHKNSKANKSFVSMWLAWFKGLVSVANLKNACKNSWKKFVNVRMLSYLLMKSMKS